MAEKIKLSPDEAPLLHAIGSDNNVQNIDNRQAELALGVLGDSYERSPDDKLGEILKLTDAERIRIDFLVKEAGNLFRPGLPLWVKRGISGNFLKPRGYRDTFFMDVRQASHRNTKESILGHLISGHLQFICSRSFQPIFYDLQLAILFGADPADMEKTLDEARVRAAKISAGSEGVMSLENFDRNRKRVEADFAEYYSAMKGKTVSEIIEEEGRKDLEFISENSGARESAYSAVLFYLTFYAGEEIPLDAGEARAAYLRRETFANRFEEAMEDLGMPLWDQGALTRPIREPDAYAVSDALTMGEMLLSAASGSVGETVEARGRPRGVRRILGRDHLFGSGLGHIARSGNFKLTYEALTAAEQNHFFTPEERALLRSQIEGGDSWISWHPTLAGKFRKAEEYLRRDYEAFKEWMGVQLAGKAFRLRREALMTAGGFPASFDPVPWASELYSYFTPELDDRIKGEIIAELVADENIQRWFRADMNIMHDLPVHPISVWGLRKLFGLFSFVDDLQQHVYEDHLLQYNSVSALNLFPSLDLGLMIFELGYRPEDVLSWLEGLMEICISDRQAPTLLPLTRRRWEITLAYASNLGDLFDRYQSGEIGPTDIVTARIYPAIRPCDMMGRDLHFGRHYWAFKHGKEGVGETYQRRRAFLAAFKKRLEIQPASGPMAYAVSDSLTLAEMPAVSAAGSVHETVEARGRPRTVSRAWGRTGRFAPHFPGKANPAGRVLGR